MGLDWNLTKVDRESEWWKDPGRSDAVTEAIIWATMACDVSNNGVISEELVPEFFARVYAVERTRGAYVRVPTDDGLEPRYITPDDIRAHVGLYTNVFPALSRARFVTKLAGIASDGGLFRIDPDPRPKDVLKNEIRVRLDQADEIMRLEQMISSS
jgi:hypothetical protein